jgi:enamine deaminase RidA (YjgF/YER057c/UK114 family)
MNIEPRLHDLGIVLPSAPTSIGFYSPWVGVGDLIYISGQLSKHEGTLMTGKLGEGLSRNQGRTAAQYCMINVLAVLKSACMNDLDHVLRAVQLSGYINATGSFREHAFVMDGASEIVQAIWGEEAGSHARTTIGCQSLPMDATMEISAIFQVKTV